MTKVGVSGGKGRECLGALLQRKEKVGKEREQKLHAVPPLMENIYKLLYLIFFYF